MTKVVVPPIPLCKVADVVVIAVPVTAADNAHRKSAGALAVLPPPLTVHVVAPVTDSVHGRLEFATKVTATASEIPALRFACVTVHVTTLGDCDSK